MEFLIENLSDQMLLRVCLWAPPVPVKDSTVFGIELVIKWGLRWCRIAQSCRGSGMHRSCQLELGVQQSGPDPSSLTSQPCDPKLSMLGSP